MKESEWLLLCLTSCKTNSHSPKTTYCLVQCKREGNMAFIEIAERQYSHRSKLTYGIVQNILFREVPRGIAMPVHS